MLTLVSDLNMACGDVGPRARRQCARAPPMFEEGVFIGTTQRAGEDCTVEDVQRIIRANERLIEYHTGRASTPSGARSIDSPDGGRPLRVGRPKCARRAWR